MDNKKNSPLLNLICNIVLPIIILTKFSKVAYLGPLYGLIAALSIPLIYGLYELIILKHKNFISLIGFIGVLLSGVIGLLKFPPQWIAVKDAAIPLSIGIIILISTNTSWQLLRKFLYNPEMLDIDQIESRLNTPDSKDKLNTLLKRANIFLSISFFFSAALNFILARIIVHSMPGTTQFNEEIGRMTMLSFPVIALPSVGIMLLVFWYILSSLKKMTQLSSNEIFSEKLRDKK